MVENVYVYPKSVVLKGKTAARAEIVKSEGGAVTAPKLLDTAIEQTIGMPDRGIGAHVTVEAVDGTPYT
jgi:hypothetical protein